MHVKGSSGYWYRMWQVERAQLFDEFLRPKEVTPAAAVYSRTSGFAEVSVQIFCVGRPLFSVLLLCNIRSLLFLFSNTTNPYPKHREHVLVFLPVMMAGGQRLRESG